MNLNNADLLAVRERVIKELSQSKTPSIPLTITRFVRYMHKIAPDLSNQQNIHLFKRLEMNLTHVLIPKLVENDLLASSILQIYRSFSKHAALPPLRDARSDEHEYIRCLNMKKQFSSEVRMRNGNEFDENKSESSNTIITATAINNALSNGYQFISDGENIAFEDYNDMIVDGSQNIHALLQEIEELKQWKLNVGMAAMAEVHKLRNMLDIYEEDANFQQQELRLVKNQSSDMHSNLIRIQSTNEMMLEENNILRFNISNTQKLENDIQRNNRNTAKLQKLNTDLLTINENYSSKNEELNDTNDRNSQYIANLRQQLLECERESAQEIEFYIQSVVDLQRENERLNQEIGHITENNEWIFQKNTRSISSDSSTVAIPDAIGGRRPHTVRFGDKNKKATSLYSSISTNPYFKFSSDPELISLNEAMPSGFKVLSPAESNVSVDDIVQFATYDDSIRISNINGYEIDTNAELVIPCEDMKADENQIASAFHFNCISSVGSGFHSNSNTLQSMNGFAKQKMKRELMLELRVEIRDELRKEIESKVEENYQIKKRQMEINAQIMQQNREKEYETNFAKLNLKWSKKTQQLMKQLEKSQRRYDQILESVKYSSNQNSNGVDDMEDSPKFCMNCLQQ